MTAPFTRSPNPAIREVARGLAQAGDAQVARVVAMVDAMPARGVADQLVAPLRGRLARLRPPRPLRFARLLFLPLDPLIVPAARWRPMHNAIPRTVVPVIAAALEAGGGPAARAAAALIAGRTTLDHAVVEAAGVPLWREAAARLMDAPPPPDWDSTGLTLAVYRPLARRIGALLSQAERLRGLAADAAQGLLPPEPAPLQAMLADVAGREPEAQPMLIALLLARVPDVGPALARAAAFLGQRGEALLRHAGEQAAEVLLDQLEAPGAAEAQLGGADLAEAGAAVRRLASLLGALDGDSPPPGRRDRLNALRDRIRTGAQSLFAERLAADLLDPLRAWVPGAGSGGDGVEAMDEEAEWALEAAARGLRALETEARRVGGGASYDTLLGQAAETVRAITARGALGPAGGMRLMEILAGSEVALALFAPEGGGESAPVGTA